MPKNKCCGCKERFERDSMIKLPGGLFHTIECASDYAYQRQVKAAKSKANKELKYSREQHRTDKDKVKPKAKWLSELQTEVNKYVRLRDSADGCISCDKPASWQGQWHCSHYFSRGHSAALRFNLWNCHKSCSVCNLHLSGNIGQYTPRLIDKIGQERYDWLVAHKSDTARYDLDIVKRAIKICRKKINRLKNRLN